MEIKQNQINNDTSSNRYAYIFLEIQQICQYPRKILSFGCSSGEEPDTLKQLYFEKSHVVGYDINKKIIEIARQKYRLGNISLYSDLNTLIENDMAFGTIKYDLIFAMSVFCKWPESSTKCYIFDEFEESLSIIDKLLNVGGYLCLYNTKFLFEQTEVFEKYMIVPTKHNINGYVKKYEKNGTFINYHELKAEFYYGNFLFKKIKD